MENKQNLEIKEQLQILFKNMEWEYIRGINVYEKHLIYLEKIIKRIK